MFSRSNKGSGYSARTPFRRQFFGFALLLSALLALALTRPCFARETAAEHTATIYAQAEIAAAPRNGNLPDYHLPPAELAKAQHLAHVRSVIHFTSEAWGIIQLLLLLGTRTVGLLSRRASRVSRSRWPQAFVFVFFLLVCLAVLNLPVDLYEHILSRRYGFSVQGWPGWFGDQAKTFLLSWAVGGLLTLLLFLVIRKLPHTWWLAFWVFFIPISLFGVFVQPYVAPLFFHYQPLASTQPALVARLEQVARRGHIDIPPERMFLMRASEKTTTLNADVEGFGHSKRVVVWDTSIQKLTPDELLFVFGHESGHYVLGHIVRGLLLSLLGSLLLLYLGFHFVRWALARFGPSWGVPAQSDWGTLPVLLLALTLFSTAAEPITAFISRQQEHAADIYGQEAMHGLVADPQAVARGAFDVLGATSLEDPNPNPFIEFWTFDHPSTGRRAAFAHAYNPWLPGLLPKYFPPSKPR